IIQSELMQELTDLLDETENLLETPRFKKCYQENSIALQELLIWGLKAKIPLPVFTATWQYLMAIAQTNSSGNFIQAQRDFFGGHGLEWKNPKPNKGKHGPWHTEDS
ncbi:MAG: hypothetical protein ACPGLR_00120, partial [Flavobacteriaceae bacterium]